MWGNLMWIYHKYFLGFFNFLLKLKNWFPSNKNSQVYWFYWWWIERKKQINSRRIFVSWFYTQPIRWRFLWRIAFIWTPLFSSISWWSIKQPIWIYKNKWLHFFNYSFFFCSPYKIYLFVYNYFFLKGLEYWILWSSFSIQYEEFFFEHIFEPKYCLDETVDILYIWLRVYDYNNRCDRKNMRGGWESYYDIYRDFFEDNY